jgi:hypothetical protein
MRADEVPDDGLLPRTEDVNDAFTFRRDEGQPFAGTNLEEEISATMLRRAKEKFQRRDLQGKTKDEQVVQSIEKGDATTEGETDADTGMAANDDETDEPRKTPKHKKRAASPTFTPVVSADDDRSYRLLRPAARQIMAKLDDTLMILHNQRMAGLGNMSESSASDEDETDAEGIEDVEEEERPSRVPSPSPAPKPRVGRPKKVHIPREGETEQEMLIRLAREGKRKLPAFASRSGTPRSRSRSIGRGQRSAASSRASSLSRSGSMSSSVSSETNREKLLARWGLRDWKDVLGAAALAGFSPAVIARATQRCSTLFREEMTIHTLHERPATSDKAGVETVRYVPGAALPSSSDEDDSEEELVQLRTVSRQSSARHGISSPEPEPQTPSRRSGSGTPAAPSLLCPHRGCRRSVEGFTKKSNFDRHLKAVHNNQAPDPTEAEYTGPETPTKRRSRSGTPGAAHLCPYPNCPRAVEGFTKRTNLTRHLQAVHSKRAAEATDDEEDSADEMDGGVHVDRFLKPIKIRKGWRADDTQQRLRMRKRARAGSEELDSAFLG